MAQAYNHERSTVFHTSSQTVNCQNAQCKNSESLSEAEVVLIELRYLIEDLAKPYFSERLSVHPQPFSLSASQPLAKLA